MKITFSLLLCATLFTCNVWTKDCVSNLKSNTKLFCYYGQVKETNDYCRCSHVVLPENTDRKIVEKIRKQNEDLKILITVREFNEKLVKLIKGTNIDGVELNLKKIDSKNDMSDFISTVKSKLGTNLYIAVAVPPKTELIAKYFDFKELVKNSDAFVLNTAFLGASQNVTFHPSRLSGLWDIQNTDSMVDLVSGLGAPLSKLVITAPVQAYKFTLQNEEYTAPGSPATDVKSIDRKELCEKMSKKGDEWTLERDQDQAGAYIFREKEWISFEDETTIDIKTKYARVRGLAGVALKDLSHDAETKCGPSVLEAAFKGLSKQARAPRAAVLHTLEREILSTNPGSGGSVHASHFRITRVIDTEGKIHVIRQDTRTEFECSRQGYFVHPRSCNRFYRCVKFDQRTDEYNVFEFDCPAGLTFDEKTEVCVWPGSIPHSSACSGSSEIAPVPRKRFTCPTEPGYYADPENCRWFFACLDHGEASMQAYEFRCPFGLVFDEEKLLCEWSWLVPKCGLRIGAVTVDFYGGALTNINQYDGLGVLQTVKLGGLQGVIPVAESKTYSNVGLVGTTDKILNHNQIIGANSAQFIDASRRLGLSLKATQSLYNAGLLSSDLSGTVLNQKEGRYNLGGLAHEINSGLSGVQRNLNIYNSGIEGSQILDGKFYQSSGLNGNQYETGSNADSFLYSGVGEGVTLEANQGVKRVSFNAGIRGNLAQSNVYTAGQSQLGLIGQNAVNIDVSGQYQNIGAQNVGATVYSNSNIDLIRNVGSQFGSKITASNTNTQNNADRNGFNENVQLIQNSEFINAIPQITPASVSYTTASTFDNLVSATPLQKVENFKQNIVSDHSQLKNEGIYQGSAIGFGDITRNVKTSQPVLSGASYQYVQKEQPSRAGSTVSPILVETFKERYTLPNPKVLVKQPEIYSSSTIRPILQQTYVGPISGLQKTVVQPSVFSSQVKTSTILENTPQVSFKQQIPFVSLSSAGEGGILTGSDISQNHGYTYDKPSIAFEEKPQVSSTPATVIAESVVTPSSGTSFSYTKQKTNYNTPILAFGERPRLVLPAVSIASSQPTATSSYHRQDINLGFAYQKPQIVQQHTQDFIASTVTPFVKQEVVFTDNRDQLGLEVLREPQVVVKQPETVLTSYSFNAPKIDLQQRPQVNVVQPQVLLQKPQKIIENYNYIKPGVQQEVVVQQQQVPLTGSSYSYAKQEIGGYKYEKPIVAFEEKPQVVVQQPQVFVSSTPATSSYHRQDINTYVTPGVYQQQLQGLEVSTLTPLVQQKIVSSNTFIKPQLQTQPVITKVPQAVVTTYSKPVVPLNNAQVVENYSFEKSVVQPQVLVPKPQIYVSSSQKPILQQTVLKSSVPQSFSYSNQDIDSGYKYEKPRIIFEEKPQVVLQKQPQVFLSSTPATSSYHRQDVNRYIYETPKVVSTNYNIKPKLLILEQQSVVAKVPQEVGTTYNEPVIQLEKGPDFLLSKPKSLLKTQNNVENYNFVKPQVVVQQPQVYISSTPAPFTYSNQNSDSGYKYEKPQIVFEEKPKFDFKYTKPSLSTNYNVNTGYKYERPSVIFEEKPQVLVKQEIVKPSISYNQVVQQQNLPVYQNEPVPVVQQPRGFSKEDFKDAAIQSYSYFTPNQPQYIVKPATILSTTYRTPVAVKTQNIEIKGYGYPRPQVQFIEEPNVVVTNYENKIPVVETPIVPKKAYVTGKRYYFQNNIQRVKQQQPIQFYSTPRPTYQSTIASIVAQNKPVEVPRQEVVYYDSRLDNPRVQTEYFRYSTPAAPKIVEYDYPKPQLQFYERPRQKLVPIVKELEPQVIDYKYSTPRPTYLTRVKAVIREKIQPIEQNFVYYDSRLSTTPSTQIQYLESTTVKPIATVTESYQPPVVQNIDTVEVSGYIPSKPKVYIHQNKNEAVSTQQQINFINQQYIEPILPISYQTTPKPTYQSTFEAVIPQKLEPVSPVFTYYDSRHTTQIPKIQYVETSTPAAPVIQNIQKVEFKGYNYPKPQVKFEEENFSVTSYENKVPVSEVPIVPKKAYITTGQSYTYNQKTDSDVKPIVLEDYIAGNYQEEAPRPRFKNVYYSTPKPSYSSTIAAVLPEKFTPVKQDFVYYDSRLSKTTEPQLQYLELSKISTKVTSPAVQKVGYIRNEVKQNVEYVEQPKRVLTKVEVNQPSIIESYVSPNYQTYETPLATSTPSSVLVQDIQPIKQQVLYYDSRLSTPQPDIVKASEVPQVVVQPEVRITSPSPVIRQELKQEVPVEPFYYYDSRLSSTQVPKIEILEERKVVPQIIRQKVTRVDSRYSSTAPPSVEPEVEYRPRVKIVKQKKLFRPNVVSEEPAVEYSIGSSTPKLGVVYAEIETKEPSSTYLPIRKKIKSSTKPSREYLPTRTTVRPSVQYLPSSTTTLSNEYIPISSSESPVVDGISIENYQNFELVRKKSRPVKVVKIVRPRVKTVVIKKNDFNPFLSAKLGAQCTCTSNTLELRKEPLKIEIPDDYEDGIVEDDDDAILVANKDGEAIVVENYEADRNDDAVTPEPEDYIRSSTVEIPSSTYRIRKVNRGRSRARNILIEGADSRKSGRIDIEASEVSITAPRVKVKTPRVDIKVDDRDEVKVKSKSRVKYVEVEDDDVEVTTGNTGILPGIDCQRAGLFRHPTQCNKFYSCRWDCKKNKFTLHVFNCPVHLTFDNNLGACNWPSQGPACLENTLLPSE